MNDPLRRAGDILWDLRRHDFASGGRMVIPGPMHCAYLAGYLHGLGAGRGEPAFDLQPFVVGNDRRPLQPEPWPDPDDPGDPDNVKAIADEWLRSSREEETPEA